VATGLEKEAAQNSSMIVRAQRRGVVTKVDADHIEIGPDVYMLRKFVGLNERTCQNQKPIVAVGDKVEKGQVLADEDDGIALPSEGERERRAGDRARSDQQRPDAA